MTEVEFARLLSQLTETAATLNRKSDSINKLIEQFQATLQKMNIGFEVWLTSDPLDSRKWTEKDDDDKVVATGSTDQELGFARFYNEWALMVRTAVYRDDPEIYQSADLIETRNVGRLLEDSRATRIAALRLFPALAAQMQQEAATAIKNIEDAEKFVK